MTEETGILKDFVTHEPVSTGGVFALGNFDGVHLGHCAVIDAARKEASKRKCPALALTFEPHPYSLFKKDGDPFRLTPPLVKNRLLHEAGIDKIVTLDFTPAFAQKSPQAFVEEILCSTCQAHHIVAGFDFVFGRGRGGDRDALRRYLSPHGVSLTEVSPRRDKDGEIISSSRIRACVRQGQMDKAAALLGRGFSIEGRVQKGDQRGRTIGFPTANIVLGETIRPLYGVYALCARQCGTEAWHNGVANIGVRPSIGGGRELAEFFLFDFEKDIYDQRWEICLTQFLRPEKTFSSLDELKAQIQKDVQESRSLLETPPIKK